MTKTDMVETLRAELDPEKTMDLSDLLVTARDESLGLCIKCGAIQYGIEPDARRSLCPECKGRPLYGIEELALMGLVFE